MFVGIWLQKVLSDMMGKATGNQTLADKKVFLYSAVSWWAASTRMDYCTIEIQCQWKHAFTKIWSWTIQTPRKLCAVIHISLNTFIFPVNMT